MTMSDLYIAEISLNVTLNQNKCPTIHVVFKVNEEEHLKIVFILT